MLIICLMAVAAIMLCVFVVAIAQDDPQLEQPLTNAELNAILGNIGVLASNTMTIDGEKIITSPRLAVGHRAGTNGFAIASLVFGIVGGALLAIIFGHISRSQIRRTGERGEGMAFTGLVLGYVWTAIIAAFLIYIASQPDPTYYYGY